MLKKIAIFILAPLTIQANVLFGEEFIGGLRNAKGTCSIERNGVDIPAQNGFKILQNDILKTGPNGSIGVIFKDNTRISMGPDSRIVMSRYVFEPDQNRFSFLAKIVKGSLSYISGSLGKLSPESVAVETPTATVGIRGTRFLLKIDNP
ncbi:MAG: hypothetical protein A2V65_12175 [Deltaproteobacteria bacterium RBG_13_49_15]|nr:MAG: hypothetical protein A2V65_12175 [Deltaproteobacteria bacterium RBG_13_49_15]